MPMISIDETTYREIAEQLFPQLENQNFFNGRIEYNHETFRSTLICTLILERDPVTQTLQTIIPVWWEYHYQITDSFQEIITDFCWDEFKHHLLSLTVNKNAQ